MTLELTLDAFAPHEGTVFRIDLADNESIELSLSEVKSMKPNHDVNLEPNLHREPFRLTFRGGSPDAYLPQQIWKLRHDVLGELELFLVPIGPDSDAMCYEAIFN